MGTMDQPWHCPHGRPTMRHLSDIVGVGWDRATVAVDWEVFPGQALDASRAPIYRWFPDGRLNLCHNALDRHVQAGRGEQTALIYDSAVAAPGGIQPRPPGRQA